MSSRAWLFPSLFEQDAAVVAAGDDRVMQLLGLANLRREIGQECEPLHVAEEPLRRAGLAVRALLVGVPQASHLGVEQLEHLGLLFGGATREVLAEPLAAARIDLREAVQEALPLAVVEPLAQCEVDEFIDFRRGGAGRVGGGNDHLGDRDDGVVLMRIEDLERPAAAEPRVQGATRGKERVGEYGGAAKREKRFTPIHAMISEGGAPRSRMAPVLGRV